MKTKEESAELKQEYEALSAKLKVLTEDESEKITGGVTDASASLYFRAEGLGLPGGGD